MKIIFTLPFFFTAFVLSVSGAPVRTVGFKPVSAAHLICQNDTASVSAAGLQFAVSNRQIGGAKWRTIVHSAIANSTVAAVNVLKVSVEEAAQKLNISIYPNPCKDILNINFKEAYIYSANIDELYVTDKRQFISLKYLIT